MSYTNTTSHYSLPQYVAADVPSTLSDLNTAYANIDTAIYDVASAQSTVDTTVEALATRVTTAESEIDTLQTDLDTAETSIEANASAISTLDTTVSTLSTTVSSNTTNISTNASDIDDLQELVGSETLETTAQTVTGAINELAEGGTTTVTAENVTYDNTDSGLTATDVQAAVDEVNSEISNIITVYLDSVTFDSGVATVSNENAKTTSKFLVTWNNATAQSVIFGASCTTDGTLIVTAYNAGDSTALSGTITNIVVLIDNR